MTHCDPDLDATMATPPPAPPPSGSVDHAYGLVMGDYELVRKIASGGMGTVWEARNTKNRLNLPVAIKMIKAGEVASQADIQRFLIEARAVASLHSHPNIVKIYGIGTHEDQFYFAMQLIRGGSLKQKLNDYRGDLRAAARLMIKVAAAIAHAHHRGILHRDLKPDNILIDEDGNPFVTDFGLAKRVDPSAPSVTMATGAYGAGVTRVAPPPRPPASVSLAGLNAEGAAEEFYSNETEGGSILGTPSYMPPEQARGQLKRISTLSDVYGLGAVLYEVLTGRPPFVGTGAFDIIARVLSEPVVPPRRINRAVDADLDAVCLKALAKEPKQRYDSAESFARDLQRWLDRKPVHARPISIVGRSLKWARREPFQAVLGGLVATALAASPLAMIVSQNARLARERERAERAEADKLKAEKELVEQSFQKSNETVEALVNAVESELGAEPGSRPLRRKLFKLAINHFENAATQWGEDEEHRYELARAHARKAEFASKLGDDGRATARDGYEQAGATLDTLIEEQEGLAPAAEVRKWRAELASVSHDFGIFHSELGDLAHALEYFLKGLRNREVLNRCHAHGDPVCYDCLGEKDIPVRAELGRSHGYLGDVYISLGRDREGFEAYQTSHRIRQDLSRKFAQLEKVAPELKFQLARSFGNLAAYERLHGELDQALPHRAVASRLPRELVTRLDARRPEAGGESSGADENLDNDLARYLEDYAAGLRSRGDYLIEADRLAEALPHLDEARKQYARLIALKPGRLAVHLALSRAALARASALLGTGRAVEAKAEAAVARAEAAKVRELESDHDYRVNEARLAALEARIALAARDLAGASKGFDQARKTFDALVSERGDGAQVEDQSDLGESMAGLGRALEAQNKRDEAVSWLKSAVAAQDKASKQAPGFQLVTDRLAKARADLARLEGRAP
ncbi:MAG: serine/threonine-protein kinase [Isosphaeraceae bacterium]